MKTTESKNTQISLFEGEYDPLKYDGVTGMKDWISHHQKKLDDEKIILRERLESDRSFDNFSELEAMKLILTMAGTRGDYEFIAQKLLDEFGSLKNVLEARPEALKSVKGIGDKTASLIVSIVPMTKLFNRLAMTTPERIGNSRDAERYCKSLLLGNKVEEFYVVCLNAQCQVIGKRRISVGSLSEVSAYPRSVVETALNYNAHSVLLSHNHPGGTCAPSVEDISSTVQLQKLLAGLGVLVLDHIIVAGEQTYSMIQHGDIDYRTRG